MINAKTKLKQVMDWKAAIRSGIISSAVLLLLILLFVPAIRGWNAWIIVRYIASISIGQSILPPPANFHLTALIAALVTHLIISIGAAILLAFIIHRWGLLVGIIGGAIFGLCLYGINFFSITYFFPWFYLIKGWEMLLSHIIFGAVAGGVYEVLEVEKFIPVETGKEE
ncbi:MAG: hypothetical protein HXY50_11650 [Ignavibacteriaceae bacterium]|nr:hypothetical protein [Ignavibacteriaceae bacterium]